MLSPANCGERRCQSISTIMQFTALRLHDTTRHSAGIRAMQTLDVRACGVCLHVCPCVICAHVVLCWSRDWRVESKVRNGRHIRACDLVLASAAQIRSRRFVNQIPYSNSLHDSHISDIAFIPDLIPNRVNIQYRGLYCITLPHISAHHSHVGYQNIAFIVFNVTTRLYCRWIVLSDARIVVHDVSAASAVLVCSHHVIQGQRWVAWYTENAIPHIGQYRYHFLDYFVVAGAVLDT